MTILGHPDSASGAAALLRGAVRLATIATTCIIGGALSDVLHRARRDTVVQATYVKGRGGAGRCARVSHFDVF